MEIYTIQISDPLGQFFEWVSEISESDAGKGVWEIWNRVAEVWGKIEPEVCQRLIESMPRRLEAVIKAKGGHTKY